MFNNDYNMQVPFYPLDENIQSYNNNKIIESKNINNIEKSIPYKIFEVSKDEVEQNIALFEKKLSKIKQNEKEEDSIQPHFNGSLIKKKCKNKKTEIKKRDDYFDEKENFNEVEEENISKFVKKRKLEKDHKVTQKKELHTAISPQIQKVILTDNNLIENMEFGPVQLFSSNTIISPSITNYQDGFPIEFRGDELLKLRFSQRTVSHVLSDGTFLFEQTRDKQPTLFDILRKNGWNKELSSGVDVVLMPDKKYTTFDNRRIVVAKTLALISHSLSIPVYPHQHSDNALKNFLERVALFLPRPMGEIEENTYGHAINSRIQLNSRFEKLQPFEIYGFDKFPKVIGENMTKEIIFKSDKVYLNKMTKF